MDLTKYSLLVLISTCLLTKDVSAVILQASKSSDKAILGAHPQPYELTCTYQLQGDESFISLDLKRRRTGETDFIKIISYPSPTLNKNASYLDFPDKVNFMNRTNPISPTEQSTMAKLQFSEIQCDDKAEYQWEITFYTTNVETATQTISIIVQALNRFEETHSLSYTPNAQIAENTEVTFTCSGDVGNEPTGSLLWFYYLNNDTSSSINVSEDGVSQQPAYNANTCSYTRQSTLRLIMEKAYNGIIVRCAVGQFTFTEHGDAHTQTTNIPVYYSPRITSIQKTPDSSNYIEGMETLTLTCSADAFPSPSYHWLKPDNTMVEGPTMTLTNITVNMTGAYTCVGMNTFLGSNYTTNQSVSLTISEAPPPTTTPEPTSSDGTDSPAPGPTAAPATGDDDKTTTIIIIVVVIVAVIIIVIVVVLIYIKTKRKPKEIEEPPEKPRNNQGLFYGNRPDLVSADHNAKNNMGSTGHNSSFNNSFDSSSDTKPRNDDGLLYIDLQFDNKPGSRRPIQLVDNMGGNNTPYADIVNPRV